MVAGLIAKREPNIFGLLKTNEFGAHGKYLAYPLFTCQNVEIEEFPSKSVKRRMLNGTPCNGKMSPAACVEIC